MSYIHNLRALPTSLAVIALQEYLDMDPVNKWYRSILGR